jgi:phenylpyruvate tautomerase PptA (4-oxalocrotonate tautomerase family)
MIDLTYTEGALEPGARAEAVSRLTDALLRIEGADPESPHARGMAWAFVHELPPGCVNIAGRPAVRPAYRLRLTVPAGTLLQGPGPVGRMARGNLVREATEIILAAEGTEYTPAESLRVYCIVREVPDGYWGGFGTTLRMDDIVATASPEMGDTPLAAQVRAAADAMLAEQVGG